MKSVFSSSPLRRLLCGLAACTAYLLGGQFADAQSQSGFTYNGLNLTSYQATEYSNSASAASTLRATGADHAAVMVTQYQPLYTSNTIAPETTSSPGHTNNYPVTPTDAAVVTAIQNLQAQGLTVSMKPQVDSFDGVFRGNFAPTNPAAWFASYQTFLLHYAQIASQNNVGILVIGTELKSLSGATYKTYWENMISQLRAQYPGLTLTYAANATGAGDEFTSVSFWADVDILGVDGYFPLTNQNDPPLSALVNAWTSNVNGFNIVAALKNLQSTYNKPLIFTEIGYVSVAGTNKTPYASLVGSYDSLEQQDCYEAFFQVFSQQSAWMKGVFWWDWTVSAPGTNDTGYSPQGKPAGSVELPKWFGSSTSGFTISPATSRVSTSPGLSASDVISVTTQGGFTGAVSLAVSGLPTGVTGTFSAGTAPGTQTLLLSANSGAALGGPVTLNITGTSGTLSATTSVAISLVAATAQTISFTSPGNQKTGTQISLQATASSGLPLTLSSGTPTVCTVNSAALTASLLTAGTCTLTANQAGNSTYSPAAAVTVSFLVSSLPPIPVPAADDVLVSQVNWRAAFSGYPFAGGNPGGGSFGVNADGNVAAANSNNLLLFNGVTGAITTLGAWSSASAVAVDSANNLYVGNPYGPVNAIVKLPYTGATSNGGYAPFSTPTAATPVCVAGGTTECVLPANLGQVNIASLAFDVSGNLFYATAGDGSMIGNSIYECTTACIGGSGGPALIYTEPKASSKPSASSGQLLVGGLSLDSNGNLFFADSSIYVNPATYALTSFYSNLNELPVSSGVGFGGKSTGFAPAPTVLYTLTPSPVGAFDNEINTVVVSRSTNGDTVYFASQNDGIFAFPDSPGGIPVANGQPTAMYAVSNQGAYGIALDSQKNLYAVAYSNVFGGGDALAQVTVGTVTVPAATVGASVSPSATNNPVSTLLNATACPGSPAAAATFSAGSNSTASATAATSGACSGTLNGGAAFATSVSFQPAVAGQDSVSLNAVDQSGNAGSVTIRGTGAGFTLAPAQAAVSVVQGSSATDLITVTDVGGFTAGVTLSASGLPSGVTAAFATNPTTGSSVLTLSAGASAIAGGPATVTITGTSGTLTATTTLALTIAPQPSFTISSNPARVSVVQGASSNTTISILGSNGFNSPVTFAASGLPVGVTASFATNPSATSTVMTLSATSAAVVGGPVTITVSGTSGAATTSTTVALSITPAPSFTLAATPASLSIAQGGSGTGTINVTPVNGFTGNVTFSASGLPAGVTAVFATNPSATSTGITLSASSAAVVGGPVSVTVTGTSGTSSTTTTLAVSVTPAPGFTLAPSVATLAVQQGNNASATITVSPTNGFSGPVTFAATGLPSGVVATFSANPAATSTVLTLAASSSTPVAGPVSITITGTSATVSTTTTLSVTITPGPAFTLSPSQSAVSLRQGASGNVTISIGSIGGFNGVVTLGATGLPAGVTASFAAGSAGTQVLTLTASSSAALASAVPITISGTSGALVASTSFTLTVTAGPGFTISGPAISVTGGAPTGNTSTLTITPTNGFSGAIALACSVTPLAASYPPVCSLSPATVTVSGGTAQTAVLSVQTTAAVAQLPASPLPLGTATGGLALATLLFFAFPRRRESAAAGRAAARLLSLLLLASIAVVGCATGSSAPKNNGTPGTSAGTYTVTITGTSANVTGTGAVTLTVR